MSARIYLEEIIILCNCFNDVSNSTDRPSALPVEQKANKQALLIKLINRAAIEASAKLPESL